MDCFFCFFCSGEGECECEGRDTAEKGRWGRNEWVTNEATEKKKEKKEKKEKKKKKKKKKKNNNNNKQEDEDEEKDATGEE